jgi:pyridoxine/pyridoxamine 5'-phosphate oxidase
MKMQTPGGFNREPPHYHSLDAALDAALTILSIGAADRRSPFHTMTVATVREDGSPSARTVVLRSFDRAKRTLSFHCDARTRKFAELKRSPRFAAHFYDAGAKLQLRLDCEAALHSNDTVSEQAWAVSQPMSRECYRQAAAPGSALDDPAEASASAKEAVEAFKNFAVISGRILALEWLYLASAGHRRALFTWRDGELRQSWLAP